MSQLPRALRPANKMYSDNSTWIGETVDSYTSPSILSLCAPITQGVNLSQRIGIEIFVKSVELSFVINTSSSEDLTHMRLALVYDKQCSSETLGGFGTGQAYLDDCYDTSNSGTNALQAVYALRDEGTLQRYITLYDEAWILAYDASQASGSAPVSGSPSVHRHMVIPVNKKVRWNNYDTANAIPETGDLVLFGWSDTNTNTPTLFLNFRVNFTSV